MTQVYAMGSWILGKNSKIFACVHQNVYFKSTISDLSLKQFDLSVIWGKMLLTKNAGYLT